MGKNLYAKFAQKGLDITYIDEFKMTDGYQLRYVWAEFSPLRTLWWYINEFK